ncbi:hypothetical protein [Nitrosomonas sp. Nm33]|uniref:hypothetical protein n=1 Tax=Nitrosomonas sp. Nm33 TaxID=133724 RepID=UPI0015A4A77E|nr:hypothetical protein [Nitrosomonas sp. Nm33]
MNRIWRLASSLWQYQRILRNKESFPYLKLDVPDARKARPECEALGDKALRWKENTAHRKNPTEKPAGFPKRERIAP